MRILVRTSRWAIWARRLGSLAVPLAILPVLMHRAQAVDTQTFAVIEIVAIAVALAALLCSIGAFLRIWSTGDQGWGKAVAGFICAILCLVPVGLWSVDYALYPVVDQVSTDAANPPPLLSAVPATMPSPADMQRISAAFPNVKTRNYPLPPAQMFGLVDKLVVERGWDVRRRREPGDAGDDGQINAIATTLFGFRDEVSIRIAAVADGSSIAMRSAALTSLHEPGVNGSRIEEFLTALDQRVTVLMKDQPAGTANDTDDTDADTAAPRPVPAPPLHTRKR